jgi:CDP-paratose 2-epimerase
MTLVSRRARQRVLITGGVGFVGTNLADRLAREGAEILIFDNLSRKGSERNYQWLRSRYRRRVTLLEGDVRDGDAVREAVQTVDQVFHFAAQVAVTCSLDDPLNDFAVNAKGTLNVLEAIRRQARHPFLIYTSTNKVYGGLGDLPLQQLKTRYVPADTKLAQLGVAEDRSLDFCSPYGCSKGAADQYVLEYARTFGIPACVFRMSCIYGPHQHGTEDQGWVAHFLISALEDKEITIYGNGRQIRDLLFIDDLVDAFLLASQRIQAVRGQVFNIGGGPANASSLLEMIALIGKIANRSPSISFAAPRPSDQLYYVSDTRKFTKATGWRASTPVNKGLTQLHAWLKANRPQLRDERREAAG